MVRTKKGKDAKEEDEEKPKSNGEGKEVEAARRHGGKRTTEYKNDRRKRIHQCLLENSLPRSTFSGRAVDGESNRIESTGGQ